MASKVTNRRYRHGAPLIPFHPGETLREEIAELKRRLHMGEVQNVKVIREKRKDLARTLTVLSEQLIKEAN